MPLGVSDLADDVKGIELQPAGQIATGLVPSKQGRSALEEELCRAVYKRLVLNELRHGKGTVHTSPELSVEVIICRAEQTGQAVALDHRLLDDIEIRLPGVSGSHSLSVRCASP